MSRTFTHIPEPERVTVINSHGKTVTIAKQIVDGNPGAYKPVVEAKPAAPVEKKGA